MQISEWEAYDRIDPIGTWRDDFRIAYLMTIVTNLAISINGKKGTKFKEISDFIPVWDQEETSGLPQQQSMEEMKKVLHSIAKRQGTKKKIKKRVTKPPIQKDKENDK